MHSRSIKLFVLSEELITPSFREMLVKQQHSLWTDSSTQCFLCCFFFLFSVLVQATATSLLESIQRVHVNSFSNPHTVWLQPCRRHTLESVTSFLSCRYNKSCTDCAYLDLFLILEREKKPIHVKNIWKTKLKKWHKCSKHKCKKNNGTNP